VNKYTNSLIHFHAVFLPSLSNAHNCTQTALKTHWVVTVTDPQSFQSRRPELWYWNELEVDYEQPPFVFGLNHWYFQVTKQKTCLSPRKKYVACRHPGLHFRYCLKYFVHTSLYKKMYNKLLAIHRDLVWTGSFTTMCGVLHRSPL
jgi:hypothetical protein